MSTPKTLKCKGLYTAGNRYDVPEGALVKATNILILRDGVIQPRWGLITGVNTSGGATSNLTLGNVSNWHRMDLLGSTLFLAGRNTSSNTLEFSTGTVTTGSLYTGRTWGSHASLSTGLDAPDGYANFTSSSFLFDTEFMNTGNAIYYNTDRAAYRSDGTAPTTTSYRAGGYSCSVSCFPRPLKITAGANLTRSGTTVTVTTPFPHGYVVGLKVTMTSAGEANFPAGEKTVVTVPTSTTFTYTEAGAAVNSANDQIFSASQFVGSSGFMTTNDQVAYRAVLVEYDASGNKYVREASSRIVVENASPFVGAAANKNVQLAVLFTTGVSNVKVELYRSDVINAGSPSAEYGLVYSKYLSAAEISARIVWITDITLKPGRPLYTNDSQTSAGDLKNNTVLAPCKTIAKWGSRAVRANITGLPLIDMQLLSVDSSAGGLVAGDVISLYTGVDQEFTAIASTAGFTAYTNFTIFTGGVATTDIRNTVLSFLDSLNWGPAIPHNLGYVGMYTALRSTGDFIIRKSYPVDQAEYGSATAMVRTISAKTTGTSTRGCFAPKLGAKSTVSSVVRGDGSAPGSSTTVVINTSSNHNFSVGEYVVWYSNWDTQTQGSVGGVAVEGTLTAVTATSMTLTTASGSEATDSSGGVVALKYRPIIIGAREKNKLYVSNEGTNEEFPEVLTCKVGSPDSHTLKCVGLNDTLLVFKEDGLFRVSVRDNEVSSELIDPSVFLWAKDTALNVRGQVIAWLKDGVWVINSSGRVRNISSGRIEDKLRLQQEGPYESTLQDMPFTRRAQAFKEDNEGLYELRVNFPASRGATPSAPYSSTVNLIYNVLNDTWVEDDLAVTSETINNGTRIITQGTGIYFQAMNFANRINGPLSSATTITGVTPSLTTTSDGSVLTASTAATFTYSGTAPSVGDTIIANADGGANEIRWTAFITSAGGGVGTCVLHASGIHNEYFDALDNVFVHFKAVVSTIEWAPITLGSENVLKEFKEAQALFGVQEIVGFRASISTDLSQTVETKFVPTTGFDGYVDELASLITSEGLYGSMPGVGRIPVPTQHRVGHQLRIQLLMYAGNTSWTLWGLGVDAALVSARGSRGNT